MSENLIVLRTAVDCVVPIATKKRTCEIRLVVQLVSFTKADDVDCLELVFFDVEGILGDDFALLRHRCLNQVVINVCDKYLVRVTGSHNMQNPISDAHVG